VSFDFPGMPGLHSPYPRKITHSIAHSQAVCLVKARQPCTWRTIQRDARRAFLRGYDAPQTMPSDRSRNQAAAKADERSCPSYWSRADASQTAIYATGYGCALKGADRSGELRAAILALIYAYTPGRVLLPFNTVALSTDPQCGQIGPSGHRIASKCRRETSSS
jgi:hypothetical protein